jgi:6-pyruvoyltetrahydropterin/6-carboxytetrahydropterin synthase
MTGRQGMMLARHIRFSINPFLAEQPQGYNSYASRPCGEGFALYFGLWVQLDGPVDADTGFVVNVVEIDRQVRAAVVPLFVARVREAFRAGRHMALSDVVGLLKEAWAALRGRFGGAEVSRMCLELNPFRKVAISAEDCAVYCFSEKFEFAAMHTLWNDKFSPEKNLEMFGKCANPSGHGHNYVVEVTLERPLGGQEHQIGEFEKTVHDAFIESVDHKNLNAQVPEFAELNPTVENIARVAWERLHGRFSGARLSSVTVWENDKTYCTFRG